MTSTRRVASRRRRSCCSAEPTDASVFLAGVDDLARALGAPIQRIPGQRHTGMAGAPQALAEAIVALS